MELKQAITEAKGNPITNGNITFRVDENGYLRDLTYNQVCLTNTDELFINNWRIIN